MSSVNFIDDFLDDEDAHEQHDEALPAWVSKSNSSHAAYEKIIHLKEQKLQYIRRHGQKSHYVKKGDYQLMKAEVAKAIGVKPQSIFNSNSYSNALTLFLKEVNKQLETVKFKKLARSQGGLRQRRKEELVKTLQNERREQKGEFIDSVEKCVDKAFERLPLDVKRKLGLI